MSLSSVCSRQTSMRLPVPPRSLIVPFTLRLVGGAVVIYFAWNMGIAPMFKLGVIDWVGALAMNVLRMLHNGITVLPVPIIVDEATGSLKVRTRKEQDDEPPKTL